MKLTPSVRAGIDTGVFLVRNHPFIRELMDTLEKKARVLPLLSKVRQHFRISLEMSAYRALSCRFPAQVWLPAPALGGEQLCLSLTCKRRPQHPHTALGELCEREHYAINSVCCRRRV